MLSTIIGIHAAQQPFAWMHHPLSRFGNMQDKMAEAADKIRAMKQDFERALGGEINVTARHKGGEIEFTVPN